MLNRDNMSAYNMHYIAMSNWYEASIYYIQRRQDCVSFNRKLAFTNSAIDITNTSANRIKRPIKLKIVYVEDKDLNDEENENSRKKRKFEEQDSVVIEGITESLGTKIGNDARLLDTINTRKEIYFKMCGMNGIIDFTDIMSGSQLYDLPGVGQNKVLENLAEKACIIKNSMENKNFVSIIEKLNLELMYTNAFKSWTKSSAVSICMDQNLYIASFSTTFSACCQSRSLVKPIILLIFGFHYQNIHSIKLVFGPIVFNKHDWATGETGVNIVDWKYFPDKTKLVLTTKNQLNELLKFYHMDCQCTFRTKILFIHILGVNAVICYMELHQDGLYKTIQAGFL
ncbi:MAG: hypothetical protein EXX96DRAFT_611815 [Benjaminiella poitrasii]|nr:MAG: hypothetical protein EXX96DRAFT_611815 [Benjaminiella poitrasii]